MYNTSNLCAVGSDAVYLLWTQNDGLSAEGGDTKMTQNVEHVWAKTTSQNDKSK